ncbi:MAG TPA: amino acid adenylation domain-containing protein, partial [Methylocella sp.]|nr:amino acid adenylation domain-containing protein [Methylocella sp.]
LMRCSEDRWFFLWSHLHVLLDGWSGPLVLKDVFTAYRALSAGEPVRLSARRPFRSYLAWLSMQDPQRAEDFWRHTLSGFDRLTPLPFQARPDKGSPEARTKHAELSLTLPAGLTQAMEDFARREKITLNTLVQGAWAILLSRLSGERDVVFGVTVSGRPAEIDGVEAMAGLFINTLPLRVQAEPHAKLAEWLRSLFGHNMAMREHEHAALVDIQRWSEMPAGEPLFESLLAFENYPLDAALREESGAIGVHGVRFGEQTHYPLTIVAFPGPQLSFNISYDCERFDAEGISRLLCHYVRVLEGVVAAPESCIGAVPLLGEEERRGQLFGWNGGLSYGVGVCLHELFEAQAARSPGAVAAALGDACLTYGELNARANRLAHYLRALGVGPESLVGLCVERSLDLVIGVLAILKAGGAYLPLDPSYPPERLSFMLSDSGARLLLSQERLLGSLPETGALALCLDRDEGQWAAASALDLPSVTRSGSLAYVIYTSGSTGRPKGVMVTHGNVARLFAASEEVFDFGAEDVWSLFHSCAFDFSVWEMWGALLYGGRIEIVPYWVSRAPEDFYAFLARRGVTVLSQTPSAFCQLLQTEGFASGGRDLSLRYVIFGGEALEPQILRPWLERYGDRRPRLVNMYGITETTVHVTYADQGFASLAGPWSVIGRGLGDLRVYILDSDLEPVPAGVSGELYVGGGGVSRGYLGRAGLTAERFVPDPFAKEGWGLEGERLYRTGDLARRRADGAIEYLGRIDHQVKIRGFRIELGEIEARLCAHPSIQQAVVAVRETGADKQLVAYAVHAEGASCEAGELRAWLRRALPDHMIPAAFVWLDALPLTPNGKIDKNALPAPDIAAQAAKQYAAPRTPAEETLCQIWAEALGARRVGRDDNFFELGGHSLLAVTIVERMRKAGLHTDVRALFSNPTPSSLAASLSAPSEVLAPPNLIPPGCEAIRPEMLPMV